MPAQLLTILKFCLLALMYLFFLRVLRAVWAEITPPKVASGGRGRSGGPQGPSLPQVQPQPQPVARAASAPVPSRAETATVPVFGADGDSRGNGGDPGRRQLVVVEPAALQGRVYPVAGEALLGRASHCTITVDDTFVSQEHVRLIQRDGAYVVEDLGSTNGTYLNRTRVSGSMIMQPGDRLQVGNTVLELR